ncbi:hypothetical protein GGG16DRAFT_119771 [Schizophyllum commune]
MLRGTRIAPCRVRARMQRVSRYCRSAYTRSHEATRAEVLMRNDVRVAVGRRVERAAAWRASGRRGAAQRGGAGADIRPARARSSKRGGIPRVAGRAARRAADADNSRRLSDGAGDPASAALRSAEAIGRGERATERGARSAG